MIPHQKLPQYPPGHLYRNGWPFPSTRGELNKSAKLTDAQVAEIRQRKARGESAAALAAEYKITAIYVHRLCRIGRKATPKVNQRT